MECAVHAPRGCAIVPLCVFCECLPLAECPPHTVCIDRLSGWIIARPCKQLWLTAELAAHLIKHNGWETFGITSVITSDQGSHFVGQWWKTMCAILGIRQAYSQAYRTQANGKAKLPEEL